MIAIGDIHGRYDKLEEMLGLLPTDQPLIFLGDYVDRGPDSRRVVTRLIKLQKEREVICLKGNHENMMMKGQRQDPQFWFMNGGLTTLRSYGDSTVSQTFIDHLRWMHGLPLYHEDDNTIFVHAGIDITVPKMENQEEYGLLWNRYFEHPLWKGKQIIYGHTPTHMIIGGKKGLPLIQSKFIAIDTACFKTGVLTAIDSETREVWQTEKD